MLTLWVTNLGGLVIVDTLDVEPIDDRSSGFRLSGEIDLYSLPAFETAICGDGATSPLVLDLSGVTFMDAAGLRVIFGLIARSDGDRPAVVIRNPSRAVRRLLDLAAPNGAPGLQIEFVDMREATPS